MSRVSAHPEFADCVFVAAESTAHAWRLMRALAAAGFRAGYPSTDGRSGVAVRGSAADSVHVAGIERACAAVAA